MLSTNQRHAFHKAIALDGASKVRRLEHGGYEVASATREGQTYLVTGAAPDGSDHICECEAAKRGLMCWHVAAVVLRRTRENAIRQARKLARRPSQMAAASNPAAAPSSADPWTPA